MDAILKVSHQDLFLEPGYLLALQFAQGWVPLRITSKQWSNLEPWQVGAIAARSNRATWDQIQDQNQNRFFEPHDRQLIYHTFWGVTPTRARIFIQYPAQVDLGSMLSTTRTISPTGATASGDLGYIDGGESPFWGPFSKKTELFTVKERYPQIQVFNPLFDAMYNVMLNADQWQYTYQFITDKALIRDMLLGKVAVKKYTVGLSFPLSATIPQWLQDDVGSEVLNYTKSIMEAKV